MDTSMKQLFKMAMPIIMGCAAFAATLTAQGAQIVVGQVAPLSGPEASQGRAYAAGMQLLFSSVNKSGGINGHTFTLVSKDDGGQSEQTLAQTRQIISETQPMVLAGYIGARNIAAVVSSGLLEKEKIALVGYRAAAIRAETPLVYNVRAGLHDELGKVTEHLATLGVRRIGLFYEQSADAPELLAATDELARKGNAAMVLAASYEAGTTRVSDAVDKFMAVSPQAIVMVCSGAAGARFIEQYRAGGGSAQMFVHSGADMERVAKRIAEDRLAFVSSTMQGVGIVQVVPSPYQVSRLAKELTDAVASSGSKLDVPMSYVVMEGFIAAKIIVEAIRRQGGRPTREGMPAALERIDNLNLGGHVVNFKQGARSGSRYVELTIISETGRIRQ
jgi:branched-chain amino acid transport system substrate-binding protein